MGIDSAPDFWPIPQRLRVKTIRIVQLLVIAITVAGSTPLTLAHSGGTDANGCHNDHRKGGYHCH
ncbi:YHYH domain-containing protein [Shinella sp. G-2]|uniref:YHYH domain-containing protein n=1 Tax=Shinella sp. G-2 TaxID=3133141 RepID=UPI003D087130